jgi:colanic acid biosynthesis glycosyl transferase WcaI
MRILFISQWFDPEPAFKGLPFARALKDTGHDVEVITGFPNYPGGKVYPGYRIRLLQREVLQGVHINRVPLFPSHSPSALGRIFNYVSFGISSCLFGVFGAGKTDVMYVYHPPLTVGMSAAIVGLIRGVPFVIDINDLWPDTLGATGMIRNKLLLKIVGYFCGWVYRRAARIVVGTPGIRSRLIDEGVPPEKTEVIYNWSDERALRVSGQLDPGEFGMKGRFNIVFAGNMGKAQALDVVIRAAKRVHGLSPRVQFVFVGGGIEVENLKRLVDETHAPNVRFLPRMSMDEVGSVLVAADVLLVHLKDDPLFEITIPSKTQAYMSVGRPILMAVKGDAARLVKSAGAGLCAPPENEKSLAEAVIAMANMSPEALSDMGRCGREYYDDQLSLTVGVGKFLAAFELAAAKS